MNESFASQPGCRRYEEMLARQTSDVLAEVEHAELQAHLRECADCHIHAVAYARLHQALRTKLDNDEATAPAIAEVLEAIFPSPLQTNEWKGHHMGQESLSQNTLGKSSSRRSLRDMLVEGIPVVTALLVIALIITLLIGRQQHTAVSPKIPIGPTSTLPAITGVNGFPVIMGFSMANTDDGWAGGGMAIAMKTTSEFSDRGDEFTSPLLYHYHHDTWTQVTPPTDIPSPYYISDIQMGSTTSGWGTAVSAPHQPSSPYSTSFVLYRLHYYGGTWHNEGIVNHDDMILAALPYDEAWALQHKNGQVSLAHYVNHAWQIVTVPTDFTNQLAQYDSGASTFKMYSANDGWFIVNKLTTGTSSQAEFYHWDGTNWTLAHVEVGIHVRELLLGTPGNGWAMGSLEPIGGSTPSDVAKKTILLHMKNGVWQRDDTFCADLLSQHHLACSGLSTRGSGDNAWLSAWSTATVTGSASVLRYDGQQWQIVPSPTYQGRVLTLSNMDVYVADQDGWVVFFRNVNLETPTSPFPLFARYRNGTWDVTTVAIPNT
jgi:hypothetical protein